MKRVCHEHRREGLGLAGALLMLGLTVPAPPAEASPSVETVRVYKYHYAPAARDFILVKISASNGLEGWGEALALGQADGDDLARRILTLGRRIVGADPSAIDRLLDDLWFGPGFNIDGLHASAVSAIDAALYDLEGQRLGKPVYELLGGARRERIAVYHTGMIWPSAEVRSVGEVVEAAKRAAASGYRAIKWDPFVLGYVIGVGLSPQARSERLARREGLGDVKLELVEEQFRLVREAVGPDVDLIIEGHGRLLPGDAIAVARRVAPFKPAFFESPVHHFDCEGTGLVNERIEFPVAQGDTLFRLDGFRCLIHSKACTILRPEIAHCGGLREGMKIARLAAEHGLQIAPHKTGSPVSSAMAMHYAAAIENFRILEHHPERDAEMEAELLGSRIFRLQEGALALPRGPGLGIDVLEEALTEVR